MLGYLRAYYVLNIWPDPTDFGDALKQYGFLIDLSAVTQELGKDIP